MQNLDIVSDCNRTVTEHFMSEDPLVANKQYGVIQCQGVRVCENPPRPVPALTKRSGGQHADPRELHRQ